MAEKEFLQSVRDLAVTLGWRDPPPYHTYDSRRSTPGFPDLCMVRGPRLVFAELKVGRGKLTATQTEWIAALSRVPGIECYVWWPEDWEDIGTVLSPRYGKVGGPLGGGSNGT